MSWKTSDIYQKKTISGYYFCKAENTVGEMITRTITLDIQLKAVFIHDPEITLLENTAEIHILISGPLTHILEQNCVKDTDICDTANITVPSDNKHILASQHSEISDFTVEVTLADAKASEFKFCFWMYDGDDLLYEEPNTKIVKADRALGVAVIIGITAALVLTVGGCAVFVTLWSRGIFPKVNTDQKFTDLLKPVIDENTSLRRDVTAMFEDVDRLRQKVILQQVMIDYLRNNVKSNRDGWIRIHCEKT
ncbi:hypothetical protein LSH36_997g02077 [Paralvinella palmiformis]|uniref:Uncharacterized protein n=1 Tax=Paralvinella palmiformis TaxID=53620 RepID=A0AAD9IXH0_9ANNE|nr:hypothetical protein LSH36_997g02077 [Paralvinella palmiformis]